MPSTNMEGQAIPDISFKVINAHGQWEDWKIRELCKNKTVVIFSLPGAYTPTCSASHLPRYEELWPVFQANGVSDVYCLSVNDTFVMNAWAKHNEIAHVKMLPDGNGDFSKAMGLLVDKSGIGFGSRSWRYSMLVKDNVISKIFLEPEEGADPYGVSDADTMMKHLNPEAQAPKRIAMITKKGCPFCAKAKELLESKKLKYVEIPLADSVRGYVVGAMTGESTVPQVWIDGEYLGGSESLEQWVKNN
eukprot:Gregarina_sp_Poly_1__747@NODE_117_length_13667_cov_177_395147_g104_i0_p5_GENE_NODE_117_length_13667_cov_177_395147_g104_i0NODE_117_length_13667_cov_177_395147_g104_i0_p5_ORF_typecomplete_len247_score33_20Redoxin/PF08534_10/8_3e29Glutaredoxin/PF00462_24/6_5e02Glutaredoxin/PF00462_24/1e11DUF836/PF05768_14/6_2e03DUF836/PF05768_14/0_0067SH3BGR/PF04908_15/0_014Thioredoxin_4/PF13462_6/1_1Thioredoxin_4/PF13462_6/26GST_N_3/PF13417_6/0_022_NODE_117_length_13667_cov_177_395147_g104_i01115211892